MVDAQRDTQELRTSSVLWRLFSSHLRRAAPQSAMRLQDGIMFVSRKGSRLIRYRDVRGISLRRGLLGRRLAVHTAEAVQTLRGLRASDAYRFMDAVRNQWILEQRHMLDEWHEANRASIEFVESLSITVSRKFIVAVALAVQAILALWAVEVNTSRCALSLSS